ncbi:MAG: CBS domain-containing protein [Candidatus Manganitrophaceae bacterium]
MAVHMYFKNVGEIVGTNTVVFRKTASGLVIALELLSAKVAGGPVIDEKGKPVGYVSEFDLFGAIERGKDPAAFTAQEIMSKDVQVVSESTSIEDAVRKMETMHFHNLPVVNAEGVVSKTVSRHDLLRASMGLGLSIETRD